MSHPLRSFARALAVGLALGAAGAAPAQALSASSDGTGLSLEAGRNWFARVGVGNSLEGDALSVGGGYRFDARNALSMHVTRQLGQERLGLAVRYDWQRTYLRLSYETPDRAIGLPDRLRFSAGVRF